MNNFASKYPAFAALLVVVSTAAKDLAATGSLVIKLEGLVNEISPVIAFLPQVSLLGAELVALKASASDIEAGAEYLVSSLAFSSTKAQSVIAAAFPVAEAVAALVPLTSSLVAAIKA